MVGGEVVDAVVLGGAVVVEADVDEVAAAVLVGGIVTVVVGEPGVDVDGTSAAGPVVEQATISSRDPTFSRIGTP